MNNPTHLLDVMTSFLTVACACLEDTPNGAPEECFISHGPPAFDCCNLLAVWVERIRPSHGFGEGQYQTGGKLWDRCCELNSVADIGIRLLRPCYPGLVDNPRNPFPGAEKIHGASSDLLIDIWVLECCLSQAACDGVLFPPGTNCLELGIGHASPVQPDGGCAGWTWELTVELDTCC